jgi:hypothetical protein
MFLTPIRLHASGQAQGGPSPKRLDIKPGSVADIQLQTGCLNSREVHLTLAKEQRTPEVELEAGPLISSRVVSEWNGRHTVHTREDVLWPHNGNAGVSVHK